MSVTVSKHDTKVCLSVKMSINFYSPYFCPLVKIKHCQIFPILRPGLAKEEKG